MTMPYSKITRGPKMSDVLKWEGHPDYCRETATLLAGSGAERATSIGMVLGMIVAAGVKSATVTPDAGNTGNGVLTMDDPAFTSAVKLGDYIVTFIEPGTDAGDFIVEGPDGKQVGTGKVAVAFTKQVKFTIADGATDFVAGDTITINVSIAAGANDGKVVQWDPSANDGSENVCGVSLNEATAADGVDAVNAALYARRDSLLASVGLVWPDGATADQKGAALAQMEDLGLIVR